MVSIDDDDAILGSALQSRQLGSSNHPINYLKNEVQLKLGELALP